MKKRKQKFCCVSTYTASSAGGAVADGVGVARIIARKKVRGEYYYIGKWVVPANASKVSTAIHSRVARSVDTARSLKAYIEKHVAEFI